MSSAKPYDIVVYGASGFTGKLCIEYLASVAAQDGTRWAIGGRNRAKLESALQQAGLKDVDILIADSNDGKSLTAMAKETKLVLSLVSAPPGLPPSAPTPQHQASCPPH